MGQTKLWQASFNAGELTPLLEAREDLQKYPNGCRRLRNFHGTIQGPARRRAGSRRVANVKNNGNAWLLPFIKGRRIAYIIELGDNYARFYTDRGQLLNGFVPYEIATPWTYADLTDVDGTFKFRTVQSNDVIYVCGGRGIKQINRFGDLNWTITDFDAVGGPFDAPNITATTVYASAATGNVTLTASADLFDASHIGASILMRPQNLSAVKPYEPNTIVTTNDLRRSDGKTYKQITAGVVAATNNQRHAGTVSPIHEEGIASDGAGQIQDTNQSAANRVPSGYDWEFQDPGYGIVKITSVHPGGLDGFVRSLLHMDGADASTSFPDATGSRTWTAAGNTQVDTASSKFGGASALFDGTGDTLTTPDNANLNIGTSDFTFDCWFNCNAAGGTARGIAAHATDGFASGWILRREGSNVIAFYHRDSPSGAGAFLVGTTQFTNAVNTGWHHVAVTRSGNTWRLFIDGVLEASATAAFTPGDPAAVYALGCWGTTGGADLWIGWLDEARLSIGIARWTANFTPQALAYEADGTIATGTVQSWRIGANAQLPAAVVGSGNPTKRFAFSLFSDVNGWPRASTFFRERFVLASSRKLAFSVPASYTEFVQETAGQLLPDNAFVVDIQSDRDEELQWLLPSSVLHVGTTGAEHVVSELTTQQVFGPENRKIEPHTGYGSNGVAPLRVGDAPLFVDASGLRVRAIRLGESGRFTANSQNDLAEHITVSTVTQTAFAALPDSLYWGVRADGRLPCLTYSVEQDVFGWSLHTIGGFRDVSKLQAAKVRSVAVIPSPDGTIDDTWMIVERYINGQVVRWVEYLTEALQAPQKWENEPDEAFKRRKLDFQANAFFVDGGVTLDNPVPITNVSVGGGGVITITSAGHGLVTGNEVRIDEVMGTWQVNARSFQVTVLGVNTYTLDDVNGTEFTPYASGGVFRKLVTTVTNLGPYEGQTVQVLTDGAVHPDRVVSGGQIALQYGAGRVHIGFGSRAIIETERPAGGSDAGSAQGELGAINHLIIRMVDSLGGRVGPSEEMLDDLEFRSAGDAMDLPPPLFSGDKEIGWPDGFSTDRVVVFVQDQPLPSIIEGFGLNMEVNG